MLEEGKRQADAAGIRNVLFERGDASDLPYLDSSFDLVVCRFAIHHFGEPRSQMSEMARVCRMGGKVAVIDLVVGEPALAETHNRLERLRDPSHATALDTSALAQLLEQAGTTIVHETSHDQALDVERWLAQADTPSDRATEIRAMLHAELESGSLTGMRPHLEDGRLKLVQRWVILVAEKGVASPSA